MPRVGTAAHLALYALLLLGVSGALIASVGFLTGSLQTAAPSVTPQVAVQPLQDNVPLPPTIVPDVPPLERNLTRREPESSFVTVGPPSNAQAPLAAPGATETFVTLGGPEATPPPAPKEPTPPR
jgi:hypothetical protein